MWQELVFVYENVDKPKQIVFKERKAKIGYEDISKLSNESKENYIENFISKDKEKGFNLGKDLLIRISIKSFSKNHFCIGIKSILPLTNS
ncbi:bacitracin synthetase 1 [Clostridium botulinum Af84]|nr:bacitracin synthetase 1 [Clostridium botulinum Af84]